jgi:MinD-like ATPase involved in chromosome partitioning or flagellar assembly
MAQTIGIIAIKGGVGKTTIAASLASDLVNHYGKKVLLVDANYSAPNLGLHMDILEPGKTIHDVLSGKARMSGAVHKRYGVDVIPGSYDSTRQLDMLKLKERLNAIKEDYDFVVLDSSPSLHDELLSAMLASDHLFVVTTPDYPTMSCSFRAAKLAHERGKPIRGIIINKIRDPSYELSLEEIEKSLELPVIARLPDDAQLTRALYMRIPAPIYKRTSSFAREISRLSAALVGEKEKQPGWRDLFGLALKKESVNRGILRESFYRGVLSQKYGSE